MEIQSKLLNQDLIFHFTKAKTAIEDILFSGMIRFSSMDEMNDPYEYKIVSNGVISWGGIDDSIYNEAEYLLRRTILKDSKVSCFVRATDIECDDFDLPFIKPRSWAQYGEEQYGVCFAFNKTALLQDIIDNLDEISIFENSVEYDLDTNSLSQKASLNFNKKLSIRENVWAHLAIRQKDIFFSKYKDFSDEKEYRIIVVDKSKARRQYLFCPINNSLQAVILGDRFHKVYHGLVDELCQAYSAKPYILKFGRVPYVSELKLT